MRLLISMLAILGAVNSYAVDSIKPEKLIGTWLPNEGYRWNIPKYSLEVNPDFSAKYFNDELSFNCPKEYFSVTNDIYQFTCFIEQKESVRLSIGGWGPRLFGFEYWIGGTPDAPKGIYGGGPVSFAKQGVHISDENF